jgi:hypothetical protein
MPPRFTGCAAWGVKTESPQPAVRSAIKNVSGDFRVPDTSLKWRFVRTRTSEGEKYYWELVTKDGTVMERIPADIDVPKPPAGGGEDEPPGPAVEGRD